MNADPPAFDQRPGDLEATRGLIPLPPQAPIGVFARNLTGIFAPGGWHVLIIQDNAELALMTPAQARALAEDLHLAADMCLGLHAAQVAE